MAIGNDKDRVRLKIGDTNEADPLLSDEEIEIYVEAWEPNVDLAAAEAAEAIANKFARDYNFAEDGQTFNRRERYEHYADLAQRLRLRGGQYVWPFKEAEEE